jgi:hypothetical protein
MAERLWGFHAFSFPNRLGGKIYFISGRTSFKKIIQGRIFRNSGEERNSI